MQKRSLLQSEMPEGPLEVTSQKELRAVARLTCRWRFSPLDAPALGSWLLALRRKGGWGYRVPNPNRTNPGALVEGLAGYFHFCLVIGESVSPHGIKD